MFLRAGLYATGFGLLALVIWVTYMLWFHPLSKYPGPLLGRITPLYATYHGWKGDIHLDMWRCHERYGDYVRYKPNTLLFNTAEGLRDIYKRPGVTIKSQAYEPMVHRAPNTFTIRGGKAHARRRRIMSQGLSDKCLRGYESRIMEHVDKFCDILGADPERAKDMSRLCNYLSFDVMADIVFGAKYDLLGSPRFRYVCEAIDDSNVRMGALVQAGGWVSALKLLDKFCFRRAIAGRNRFVKFVTRLVASRLGMDAGKDAKEATTEQQQNGHAAEEDGKKKKEEEQAPDLFSRLQDARDPDTGDAFTLAEIGAESTTLIVAGSDTSSTSLASILFYLAHTPAAHAKAAAEVRGAFARPGDVASGPALASCRYLRACVDEALRMSPAVGSCLLREVAAAGGAVVDGRAVPAGCDVGVPIYSIHHSRRYFREPFAYRPERWTAGGEETERALSVLNPFSVGLRSCLGKALAMTELQLAVAAVLVRYDLVLAEGELGTVGQGRADGEYGRHRENEYQLFDHVTSQKHGPFLKFRARE